MDKMTKKIVAAFFAMLVVAAVILVGFYMLNKVGTSDKGEVLPKTEAEKLKAKDLELKYPATPSEVLKLYWRFNKCMYNEKLSDEDTEALMKQLRMMYDEEFLALDGNSYDNMMANFQADKESFTKAKRFITSCIVEEEDQVEYAKLDGKECATLNVNVLETVNDSKTTRTAEKFICRKDGDGKWKIMGWEAISSGKKKEKSK